MDLHLVPYWLFVEKLPIKKDDNYPALTVANTYFTIFFAQRRRDAEKNFFGPSQRLCASAPLREISC
jgi:hypothetical protein